jgi:multimeric flavodoxin WrbA
MSERTILILNSSPRSESNSAILAGQVAEGARAAGANVEVFDLHNMDIRPCDACDFCQETDGACVIGDDMQLLYPKLRQAHGILIASPVYWFTLSAQAKLCIDRWYALQGAQGSLLAGKRFGLVLAYGDTDPYTSGAINAIHTYQDMLRYLHAESAGVVYASANEAGAVRQQPETLARAYRLGEQIAADDRRAE